MGGCMPNAWICCKTQQGEGNSGQRRVSVEGRAREDPGREGKLGKGLELGWYPGKAWLHLRKTWDFWDFFCFVLFCFAI